MTWDANTVLALLGLLLLAAVLLAWATGVGGRR